MYYSTVYVGMDVHKESFSLCCYTNEKETAEYPQKIEAHYSKVINYLEAMWGAYPTVSVDGQKIVSATQESSAIAAQGYSITTTCSDIELAAQYLDY